MLKDFTIANMLDMSQTIAGELFEGKTYPWEVLPEIGDFIVKLGKTLDPDEYDCVEGNVWIAKTAKVAPTAFITIMVYFFSLNIPIRKKIHYAVFMSVYLNALAILKGKLPLQAEISGHAAMFILIFNIFFSTLAFSYVAYAYYQKFMASEAKILQYNKKLEQMASTDALTSLWNRRAMTQHLSMLSQQYVKHHMNFCVAILDIDFFKHVNDEHGHGMGDYVLKSLSYILKSSMEGRGQVARWGGEEFLLTFENTELDRAYKLLDQIRARIAEQEFTFKDVSLHLTITGGIEEYSMTESIDAIITRADEKLYRGKTSGRNQIVA